MSSDYDYRFRNMSEYNYTHTTPTNWQAWHEAYFSRIGKVLRAEGEWIRLLNSGCTTEEWTTPNCTRTCSNATALFRSPENVWNCMALATVTMEVVQGNKTVDPDNLQRMDDIFDFGGSLEAFDRLRVFGHVRRCFWQSCSDSRYGSCTAELQPFRCGHITPQNMPQFAGVLDRPYCRDAGLGVDSDIAGPGVLVAYMIQVWLVLILAGLFWSAHVLTTPCYAEALTKLRGGLSITPSLSQSSPPGPPVSPGPSASEPSDTEDIENTRASKDSEYSKVRASFTTKVQSTVLDLQEAQVAFVLTIGILFLVAFRGGHLGLANIASVFSYIINYNIAFGLLVIGTTSVGVLHSCTQRTSERADGRRDFTLFLVLGCWLLMIVAHGFQSDKSQGSWADPAKFINNLRQHAGIEDCGNNPGPMSFCLGPELQGPGEEQQFFVETTKLVWAAHVIFVVLVLEEALMRFGPKCCPALPFPVPLVANMLGLVVLLVGFVEICKAFEKIARINNDQHSWGFGQLVATAVWIPVVVKLVALVGGFVLLKRHSVPGPVEVEEGTDKVKKGEGKETRKVPSVFWFRKARLWPGKIATFVGRVADATWRR